MVVDQEISEEPIDDDIIEDDISDDAEEEETMVESEGAADADEEPEEEDSVPVVNVRSQQHVRFQDTHESIPGGDLYTNVHDIIINPNRFDDIIVDSEDLPENQTDDNA